MTFAITGSDAWVNPKPIPALILRLSVFCKRKPEADSVHYAASELFVCIRFGSFQFGRTKWHV